MKAFIIIVLILCIAMYGTNPGMTEFKQFTQEELQENFTGNTLLGKLLSKLASTGAEYITERNNYMLFSVYTVDMGREKVKFLGVFKTFYKMQ